MRSLLAERWKSSVKCVSALRTGSGVRPPIAHSEPSVITSHRSTSTTRFASRSVPATIRRSARRRGSSRCGTGVHLPHDSIAQNSIANRA